MLSEPKTNSPASSRYELLFSPASIGKVKLKNRIVKTAAQTYFFDSGEERVGARATAYYSAIARGGAGLIITETPAMEWPLLEDGDRRFRVDSDKYLKQLEAFAKEIHRHGVPLFTQFYHRGPWSGVYALAAQPSASSAVTYPSPFDVHDAKPPHALTIEEIEFLVDRFASGAARLQQAGWDGVEVNAGGDHLFHTFLSRFWNKREDKYGGQSLENRTRFFVEVIKEIKKRCGQDFPVQALINGIEVGVPNEQALSLQECKEIARMLVAAGADSLHVRSHWAGMHQGSYNQENMFYPEPHIPLKDFPKELDWSRNGALAQVPIAAEIKKVVQVPVMTVGLIDADSGEQILREGKADLIGINRRFSADPEWANKVREGRLEDIQPCTHCATCNKNYNLPRYCRINACFGTESYDLKPTTRKKQVVVVGGGPGGMQAARVAAMRGHSVTLFEKGRYLGGSVPLAAMVKGFEVEALDDFLDFFKTQVKKLGVDVRLRTEFNAQAVKELKPDAVILATGGTPTLPEVKGINRKNVIKAGDLYSTLRVAIWLLGPKLLRELTRIYMPVGKRVVIIGGAIQGCQLAEFLIKRGRQVTIVETGDEFGKWLVPERKTRLFYWFDQKGIERLTGVKLVEIHERGLEIVTREGQKRLIEADNIIPALPFAANSELLETLKGKVPEVYSLGDCTDAGVIPDAIRGGWEIGNAL
jgi:2,4-dienoyl-CoA reductase (NADPH2)